MNSFRELFDSLASPLLRYVRRLTGSPSDAEEIVQADPGERKATLDKLVTYYRERSDSEVRTAFDEWLGRRKKDAATSSSKLVADLEKAIGAFSAAR